MSGWVIGFAVGGAVVLVVVAVLLAMIAGARQVRGKAEAILAGLETARDNTAPLWALQATNATADRIVAAATEARGVAAGTGGRS